MRPALPRRGLVAVLLLMAAGVAAQPAFNPNDPNAGPPPADAVPPPGIDKIAHTLEAYKKEGGVAPEVWDALDKFRPADVDEKHKKAPKQIDSGDRARNMSRPDTYFTGATKTVYELMARATGPSKAPGTRSARRERISASPTSGCSSR